MNVCSGILTSCSADETRKLQQLLKVEDEEALDQRIYVVPSTGALLDLDNAKAHLYHFCDTLPASQFVDRRPEFICEDHNGNIKARVILPLSVTESLRTANSLNTWKSEKNAIKDASFEAYVALHKAGLIGDNLLPQNYHDEEVDDLLKPMQKRVSILEVRQLIDPWTSLAKMWHDKVGIRKSLLTLDDLDIQVILPVELPKIMPFKLYWDATAIVNGEFRDLGTSSVEILENAIASTQKILTSGFGHRFVIDSQPQPVLFLIAKFMGAKNKLSKVHDNKSLLNIGLIYDLGDKIPYALQSYLEQKPAIEEVQQPYHDFLDTYNDEPHFSVKRLPRRHNFLQKVTSVGQASSKQHAIVVPASRAQIGVVPFEHIRFALMVPSILHHLGIYLIAQTLRTTLLKDLQMSSLELIRTAICASSAQELANYQRLEFLGDSALKLCTSIQLFDEFPLFHEGLLSFKKDRIVSNGRLARAAIDTKLDQFIVTKQFTGKKWRPTYVADLALLPEVLGSRQVSSKILADVVEALIGAATVEGGIPKSLNCMSILLPDVDWQDLSKRQASIYVRASEVAVPTILEPVERLVGYNFNKGSLLVEALTHASSIGSTIESLERLEFLGDAILDNIVVAEMWNYNLSHYQMHTLRTAMVNADYLAWLCLESSIDKTITIIDADQILQTSKERWPLWRFLRHSSSALAIAQQATAARHLELRDEINAVMRSGTQYPWALLSRLDAGKFFSDMIESLLGAIWIDSHVNTASPTTSPKDNHNQDPKTENDPLPEETLFTTCKAVLEHLGVLPYMRRIIADKVHILHPKEELGILADRETVKYILTSRKNGRDVEGGVEYLCTVFVGDREIVRVDGGVSKVEVKTKAAECAVRVLKRERLVDKEFEGGSVEM